MTVPAASAPSDASFDEAYRDLVASDRYQTELPVTQVEPPEMPGWLAWLLDLVSGSGGFWQVVFWMLVAALAIALLILLARRAGLLFQKRSDDEAGYIDDLRPEEQPARALLEQADKLAREGRYAEAVHLLLFRSIEHIEERLPEFLRPALTSREISGSRELPETPRLAFAEISRIVERGLFAKRPVGQSGWSDARAAYERFAFGEWA